MRKLLGLFLLLLAGFGAHAQQGYTELDFLVVYTTPSFREAKAYALMAAQKLALPVDSSRLWKAFTGTPQVSWAGCDSTGTGEKPCYLPRGRYNEVKDAAGTIHYNTFVSIEYGDGYKGWSKKKYYVVIGSGNRKSEELRSASIQARKKGMSAVFRKGKVYLGCTS